MQLIIKSEFFINIVISFIKGKRYLKHVDRDLTYIINWYNVPWSQNYHNIIQNIPKYDMLTIELILYEICPGMNFF